MSRLVAYLSNDPNRIRCAFHGARELLVVGSNDNHDGWGLGYFQHGEILLQKRPQSQRVEIRAAEIVKSLHTDALLLHVREATVGSWKHDNTHPFRFRSWLFAHRGTIREFAAIKTKVAAQIPEFLRRNIRGETDSEFAFHLFLARLYEKGKLDDPNLDARYIAGVLAGTIAQLDDLTRKAGATEESKINIAVMNGRVLAVTRRGLALHYFRRDGIADCEACRMQQEVVPGRAPRISHPLLRFVLAVTDLQNPPSEWNEVPEGSVLTVNRQLEVAVASLAL
jgi:glutamine amidotransferase